LRKNRGWFRSRAQRSWRLEENLGAVILELTADDIHALEEASSKIKLEGARYPKFHEQLVGR
jgi:hypothetical protein